MPLNAQELREGHNAGTDTTTIANHRRFDSFGNLISETNAAVDLLFGFTGRTYDENSKLQNNWNRWYDAEIGQWISEDPIGFAGGTPNIREYVSNSPTGQTDPSGLREVDDSIANNVGLPNAADLIENEINRVVLAAFAFLMTQSPQGFAQFPLGDDVVEAVYAKLGKPVAGSGLVLKVFKFQILKETAPLTGIELWLERDCSKYTNSTPFKDSIYGVNEIRALASVAWFKTERGAQHGLAHTVNINGTIIGTDKLGHMFEIGYWLWWGEKHGLLNGLNDRSRFSAYLEGDDAAKPFTADELDRYYKIANHFRSQGNFQNPPNSNWTYFGILGTASSGVVSYADMYANERGYLFYSQVERAAHEKFQFGFFDIEVHLNEQRFRGKKVVGIKCK